MANLQRVRERLADLSDAEAAVVLDCVDFAIPHFADSLLDYAEGTPEGSEVRERLAAARELQSKLVGTEVPRPE